MSGYLPVPRDEFFKSLFEAKKTYELADAYLDLQQLAAFAPTERPIKNKFITLNVGELVASERFLETRWGWSRTKVRGFLNNLTENQKLDQRKDQGQTILSLCSYWTCDDLGAKKEPPIKPEPSPKKNQKRTKVEEGNKEKNKEPLTQTPAIAWSLAEGFTGISSLDYKNWNKAYPSCDLPRQLAAADEWLRSNPSKAKKKLWRKFITGWLGRAQERGGDIPTNKPKPTLDQLRGTGIPSTQNPRGY